MQIRKYRQSCTSNRADNERKAQKVLIIMFIIFVAAWLPFFLVNSISGLCKSCNSQISSNLILVITWLGYLASMANPIIYTMFNKKFRVAFNNLLRCNTNTQLVQGSIKSNFTQTKMKCVITLVDFAQINTEYENIFFQE